MPIINTTRGFEGLLLDRLPTRFITQLSQQSNYSEKLNGMVVRLQCFLEITGQRLSEEDLNRPVSPAALTDFATAVFCPQFTELRIPWHQLRNLRTACAELFPDLTFPSFPCTHNKDHWSGDFRLRYAEVMDFEVDPELAEFWSGWPAENAKGELHHVRLAPFWQRYGAERTREFFEAYSRWRRGASNGKLVAIDSFAAWAAARPEPVPFDSGSELGEALTEFFHSHMKERHATGRGIKALVSDWRVFANALTTHLFGEAWATPSPSIPMPSVARSKGSTGLRPNQTISRQVLLSSIPLHISDSAAADLLFRDIQCDLETIKSWARLEIAAANEREANRRKLALEGIASVPGTNGIKFRASQVCPEWLAHASATFEQFGFSHVASGRASSLIYPEPTSETCWELGLPTPALLLAHSALLAAEHPEITPAALSQMNLFDKNGTRVGYVENDGGSYLIMQKARKGPRSAEQRIALTEETKAVALSIIRLTQPLREWLREKQNPLWRRLMLAIPSMGVAPGRWRPGEASRQRHWLAQRLAALLGISQHEAERLGQAFSMRRVRASAAVVVYLHTGSAEKMSKALGHETYEHRLMDRYLPRALQDFFNDRYIRLFQTGILCEALKNSPFLLDAINFSSSEELNEFLENSVIRFPEPGLDAPHTRHQDASARVVFAVEPQSLSVLMSIEEAVSSSAEKITGHALKWSKICRKLVSHLETQVEQPEFHRILNDARANIDVASVRDLIHA